MELPNELKEAAQELGRVLREHEAVERFHQAMQAVNQDEAAAALEREVLTQYETLVTRQQNGERLAREEVDAFYALNRQLQSHPLVAERTAALSDVKVYFVDVGERLSGALGVRYPELAD
ncbi:MAG: hypothetical protein Kow0077_03040 [Anaerolineae bacterium]